MRGARTAACARSALAAAGAGAAPDDRRCAVSVAAWIFPVNGCPSARSKATLACGATAGPDWPCSRSRPRLPTTKTKPGKLARAGAVSHTDHDELDAVLPVPPRLEPMPSATVSATHAGHHEARPRGAPARLAAPSWSSPISRSVLNTTWWCGGPRRDVCAGARVASASRSRSSCRSRVIRSAQYLRTKSASCAAPCSCSRSARYESSALRISASVANRLVRSRCSARSMISKSSGAALCIARAASSAASSDPSSGSEGGGEPSSHSCKHAPSAYTSVRASTG